ncbi:hypothetical protein TNCV_619781 [Trichonephila clavipes]|nr:hypothetical protein TNCV_619781 [Trichonephila clavipes]
MVPQDFAWTHRKLNDVSPRRTTATPLPRIDADTLIPFPVIKWFSTLGFKDVILRRGDPSRRQRKTAFTFPAMTMAVQSHAVRSAMRQLLLPSA